MKAGKSLSTKIILMVVAIVLFSGGIFCVISISRAQVAIRKAIQQRMVDIANCASGSVNGDILKDLYPGDEDTPEYKTVYDSIAVFRDNAELEYIYGIRDEGDGRFTFTVDPDLDAPANFGDEVKYTEALERASKGVTAVDEVPYTDQWGEFYSAYSPVFDSAGRVVGIIGADFSREWFDGQLRDQMLPNVLSYVVILLVTLLAAVALCLVTVRPYVRLQEQLLEEKVTAESANQAKSDFLASMSHEIRTPINAVLGMNEMILRESRQGSELTAGKPEETRKAFDQIGVYAGEVDSAGRSLLTIINDILDFSKIEAGRMELVKAHYQLSSLLNDVSNMILFKARDKNLDFTVKVDSSLPDNLFGDELRVREIITNILNNAVKYTEKGYVRMTVHGRDIVGSTIRLVVVVEDSGIGIKKADMDKLFSKFQRLDMQRNSTVEGSGLGLVITRRLLDMMDGTISVESEYGRGSAFTVTIPQRIVTPEPMGEFRTQAEMDAGRVEAYHEAFRAPDARILIVDDTKMNLMVTASLLKSTQIRIDTAGGGAESVAMAAEKAYDVILMDQRMPEMDGTEALRLIRAQENSASREAPVICLTADAIAGARERYLSAGFTDYLTKPVDGRKLEAMLMRYLPKEKVIAAAETETEAPAQPEQPAQAEDGAQAALRAAGIDPETGLNYCQGDEELYRSLLGEYVRDHPEKSAAILRNYETGNWKDYGIYVHALKSSSRMLGAQELSGMAAQLEKAADAGDEETIRRGTGPMMERYRATVQAIRSCMPPEAPEPADGPEPEEDPEVMEFSPEE